MTDRDLMIHAMSEADRSNPEGGPTPRGSEGGALTPPVGHSPSWPFDPAPRALEPAQNGFIWCEVCEGVREVKHECAKPPLTDEHPEFRGHWDFLAEGSPCLHCGGVVVFDGHGMCCTSCAPKGGAKLAVRSLLKRAEFAESLLCAIFFAIQRRIDAGQSWNEAAGTVLGDVIDMVEGER